MNLEICLAVSRKLQNFEDFFYWNKFFRYLEKSQNWIIEHVKRQIKLSRSKCLSDQSYREPPGQPRTLKPRLPSNRFSPLKTLPKRLPKTLKMVSIVTMKLPNKRQNRRQMMTFLSWDANPSQQKLQPSKSKFQGDPGNPTCMTMTMTCYSRPFTARKTSLAILCTEIVSQSGH